MRPQGYNWVWLPTRLAIYARDHFRCLACGRRGWWRAGLSLDHVVPGGPSTPANLVTLCLSCNSEKGDRPLRAWRPELAEKVRAALRLPIDRDRGRKLAEKVKPGWLEGKRAKDARRRARLRAGHDPLDFPSLAAERYPDATE
jgi:hypothetical protein